MKNNIKIRLLQVALLALVFSPILADIHDRIEYKLNRVLRDVEIINNEIAAECTVIRPEDFEDADGNLTQTYVIATPGKYCLGGNVDFVPEDEFTPAIVILSDDVSLSLNGFTLSQANDTPNAYGVQIGQGYNYDDPDFVLKNITIFNGNITDFTAIGVFCYNGSFDGPTAELPFQDLHFFDLNIFDCGTSPSSDFGNGIDLDSFADIPSSIVTPADPVAYSNIIIENCNVNHCVGTAAINIFTFDNLVIQNTQANNFSTTTQFVGLCAGYFLTGRNLQMSKCQGNGTQDFEPEFTGSQCGGIYLTQSLNLYIEECQFNDAFGLADYIVNNNTSLNENAVFENCQFNNNRGGDSAIVVAGVHMSEFVGETANTNGMRFINCQFNGTSVSEDAPAFGGANELTGITSIANRNVIFENCQACNIITTNPNFKAVGFLMGTQAYGDISPAEGVPPLGRAHNITFRNCIASDITGGTDAYGIVVPASNIYLVPTMQGVQLNIVIEDCIVERVSSVASDDTRRVAGITESLFPFRGNPIAPSVMGTFYDKMRNLFIRGCRVSDVRSNVGGIPIPLSAGILVESVQFPVIIGNSVSDCDRGILLTGTNDILPNGFQLAATFADATAFPPIAIDLNTIPASSPAQDFFNITQGNGVSIAPSTTTINRTLDLILPIADITALGWQPGDAIFYDCNGGDPISDLVCSTTYYAIVYIPGFSENGVVQQNEVDNCSISGYQDDAPTTLSAWVDNTAFNDGTPASAAANYAITWAGVPPVDAGTLAAYPTPGSKYYNLSLIP